MKTALCSGLVVILAVSSTMIACTNIDPAWDDEEMMEAGRGDAVSTGHLSNNLAPQGMLSSKQYLVSPNGQYRLYLQSDGNLVLRRMSTGEAIWATATHGKSAKRLYFQGDGNLVLRTAANAAVWASHTDGSRATLLRLNNDGSLALYRGNTVLWSAGGGGNDPGEPKPPDPPKPPDADSPLAFPIRGAFYYPWYPQTWTVEGKHVPYHPDLGYYTSDDTSVIDEHIKMMDYAKIDMAIASWWGPNTFTNTRIPLLLNRTAQSGSHLKWAIYYEDEGFGNPSVATLQADLKYIKDNYASHQAFARIGGKPVIFVYNADENSCEVASRWKRAAGNDWYVVLKVVSGYKNCSAQPSFWHQYGCPINGDRQSGYSYLICPGFWRADQSSPRYARNLGRWYQNVRDMVASSEPFQLVVSFNEWGEGTAVESAAEWRSSSGFGSYLDALHTDGR